MGTVLMESAFDLSHQHITSSVSIPPSTVFLDLSHTNIENASQLKQLVYSLNLEGLNLEGTVLFRHPNCRTIVVKLCPKIKVLDGFIISEREKKAIKDGDEISRLILDHALLLDRLIRKLRQNITWYTLKHELLQVAYGTFSIFRSYEPYNERDLLVELLRQKSVLLPIEDLPSYEDVAKDLKLQMMYIDEKEENENIMTHTDAKQTIRHTDEFGAASAQHILHLFTAVRENTQKDFPQRVTHPQYIHNSKSQYMDNFASILSAREDYAEKFEFYNHFQREVMRRFSPFCSTKLNWDINTIVETGQMVIYPLCSSFMNIIYLLLYRQRQEIEKLEFEWKTMLKNKLWSLQYHTKQIINPLSLYDPLIFRRHDVRQMKEDAKEKLFLRLKEMHQLSNTLCRKLHTKNIYCNNKGLKQQIDVIKRGNQPQPNDTILRLNDTLFSMEAQIVKLQKQKQIHDIEIHEMQEQHWKDREQDKKEYIQIMQGELRAQQFAFERERKIHNEEQVAQKERLAILKKSWDESKQILEKRIEELQASDSFSSPPSISTEKSHITGSLTLQIQKQLYESEAMLRTEREKSLKFERMVNKLSKQITQLQKERAELRAVAEGSVVSERTKQLEQNELLNKKESTIQFQTKKLAVLSTRIEEYQTTIDKLQKLVSDKDNSKLQMMQSMSTQLEAFMGKNTALESQLSCVNIDLAACKEEISRYKAQYIHVQGTSQPTLSHKTIEPTKEEINQNTWKMTSKQYSNDISEPFLSQEIAEPTKKEVSTALVVPTSFEIDLQTETKISTDSLLRKINNMQTLISSVEHLYEDDVTDKLKDHSVESNIQFNSTMEKKKSLPDKEYQFLAKELAAVRFNKRFKNKRLPRQSGFLSKSLVSTSTYGKPVSDKANKSVLVERNNTLVHKTKRKKKVESKLMQTVKSRLKM